MLASLVAAAFAIVSYVGSVSGSQFPVRSALTPRVAGSTAGPYGLGNAHCVQDFYEVSVNSTNTKFVGLNQTNLSQMEITALILEFSVAQSNFTEKYINGTFEFSSKFNISGTLCTPIKGAKQGSALQLLVHGIGFDSSYWDFDFTPDYSYVNHAASHGYTTFRYDRIGTGLSETPQNGFDVAQASTEVAILREMNTLIHETTAVGGQKWPKVVGIGHSYGSVQTQAVSASNPELYDAVILQGYSVNSSFLPNYMQACGFTIARDALPQTLGDKPPTWLATATPATNQIPFWYFPFYEEGAFSLARQTEQPVTPGTLFTIASVDAPSPTFNKPVQAVLPDKDFIFAGSNAYGGPDGIPISTFIHTILYPNASSFESYIPANTGHAANTHLSAPETYEQMISFIARHGL